MKITNCIKILLLNCLFLLNYSCAQNTYRHTYELKKPLNLREGNWLINHIEADLHAKAKKDITDLLLKKLIKLGGKSITFIETVKPDSTDPAPPMFNTSTERLIFLDKNTNYDFLVNTNVELPENRNFIKIGILIYAINSTEVIYSQTTINQVRFPKRIKSSDDLTKMIIRTLKRALRKLEMNVSFSETINE